MRKESTDILMMAILSDHIPKHVREEAFQELEKRTGNKWSSFRKQNERSRN